MKYRNRKSGSVVEVRDSKVLNPQEWEKADAPTRKSSPRKRSEPTDDD